MNTPATQPKIVALRAHTLHFVAAAVVGLVALLLCGDALAQTPNPLMRPASRESVALPYMPANGSGNARVPQARPVPDGGAGGGSNGAPASYPPAGNLSPYAAPDSIARDELSGYGVTAVVDKMAVLRLLNNGDRQAQGESGANSRGGAAVRPPVLWVQSGQALTVSTAQLIPTVNGSQVEFRSTASGPTVAVVGLESQSAKSVPELREIQDPTVAARLAPGRSANASNAAQVPAAGAGAGAPASIGSVR